MEAAGPLADMSISFSSTLSLSQVLYANDQHPLWSAGEAPVNEEAPPGHEGGSRGPAPPAGEERELSGGGQGFPADPRAPFPGGLPQ